MKPGTGWAGKFARDEAGAVTVFFAFALPVLLLILALVIDMGLLRLTGNRLQISADAAALAGVAELPEDDDVRQFARLYSGKNYPDVGDNPILIDAAIETGNWDGAVFTAGGTPKDAVRVTTRRAAENNNPLAVLFASLAGISGFEASRTAVAHVGERPNCDHGGFFSNSNIVSGSSNEYTSEFCIYGRNGVHIGSANSFGPGSVIGMVNIDDFEQGQVNEGAEEALTEMEETLLLPALVPDIIADLQAGTAILPDFITADYVFLDEITRKTEIESDKLYVVSGDVDLGNAVNLSNIAIVATGNIELTSNSTMENIIFAADGHIHIGSNNIIGGFDFCGSGSYNSYFFSRSDVILGANNQIRAAQLSAEGNMDLGSNILAMSNVYAEAMGTIEFGSAEEMGTCEGGLESHYAEIEIAPGKGDMFLVQ